MNGAAHETPPGRTCQRGADAAIQPSVASTTTATSTTANLTVNPAGVSIALYAGVTIDGVVGLTYGIHSTSDLSDTNKLEGFGQCDARGADAIVV